MAPAGNQRDPERARAKAVPAGQSSGGIDSKDSDLFVTEIRPASRRPYLRAKTENGINVRKWASRGLASGGASRDRRAGYKPPMLACSFAWEREGARGVWSNNGIAPGVRH